MFTYFSNLSDGVDAVALSMSATVAEEHLIGVDELEDHISGMKAG